MLNLRSVDMNLLPVFEAAYEERSLSRAATRLAMTQPAVSHALSRLRVAFRDELFVRHSRGMTPTATADAVYGRLGEALALVRAAVAESRGFDPKASERRFTIAIPDPMGPMLALRMLALVESEAPGIALAFSTRSRPIDLERGLREGTIDLAVDWLPATAEGLTEQTLFTDDFVAIARKGHPAIRQATSRKSLTKWKFVALRPRADLSNHPLEAVREWVRVEPTVALLVSEYLEVLVVVRNSDLIGVAPRSLVNAASAILDIRVIPRVPRGATFPLRMIWRSSRSPDPAHQFLRNQMRIAAKEVIQGSPAKR